MDIDEIDVRNEIPIGQKQEETISSSLHPIEKKLLSILKLIEQGAWMPEIKLAKKSGLSLDQLRRGIEWLKYKGLIQIVDSTEYVISLHSELSGQKNIVLPERKLVDLVNKGKNKLSEIISSEEFHKNEKEVYGAIRFCKKNNWIIINNNIVSVLTGSETLSDEEKFINKLNESKILFASQMREQDRKVFESLKKRPNIINIEKRIDKKFKVSDNYFPNIDQMLLTSKNIVRKMSMENLVSGKWRDLDFEQIDVEAPLPLLNCGKKNPLIDFIDEVKEILIGMGFSEIDGDLAQSSFWNFDALFIPQDHSAREMQDTFYLKSKKSVYSPLPKNSLIQDVSQLHQRNWQYEWDSQGAKPYVLRTHTTPVTLQYLSEKTPEKDKVFLIGRVFRNEKVTFKHLVEFHQVEGIYVNEDANLRQLIGIQSEFYSRLGIKKVKFWPTFFPYTEPSLQSMVFNEKFNKWIELFGMGIFRPEVTKPLGIKNPVLAWGGGFERLAMLRFNLDDIRELYSNNLTWLKSVPKCLL